MSKLDKEQVIEAFTQAYTSANGKAPKIEAKGGWYSVDGGKNMRLADLDAMIADLGKAAPAAKPAKKAEAPKKAAADKPKAAAKKAPAKKKAKKSDFSVKAFWADQILSQNTGSKLPR